MSTSSLMSNKSMVVTSSERASNTRQREAKGHHLCKRCLHYPVQKGGTQLEQIYNQTRKSQHGSSSSNVQLHCLCKVRMKQTCPCPCLFINQITLTTQPWNSSVCTLNLLFNDIIVFHVPNGNKKGCCSVSPPHQTFQILTLGTCWKVESYTSPMKT